MEEEQAKKEFAVIEEEVLNWVADIELVDLLDVSELLGLDVDEDVKVKRNLLLKLILKHLLTLGDADDGGYASYKLIHERYVRPLNNDPDHQDSGDDTRQTQDPPHFRADQNRPLTTMQLPPLGRGIGGIGNGGSGRNYQSPLGTRNNPSPQQTQYPRNPVRMRNVNFDVKKLKDFKINGTIGGTEKEGKLTYSSLLYQIQNAQGRYDDDDICAAVIKAISVTDPLRTYFEMHEGLTLDLLKQNLKNQFKEKDSAAYVAELCSATQNPEEACDRFVLRLLCLCQKIKALSTEEGCPYNQVALRKNLFRTIFTGMRNSNIRIDLRESCKRQDVSLVTDEELLKLVAEAVANEGERTDKLCGKKDGACSVNQIDRSEKKKEEEAKKKRESTVPAQIDAVKVAHDKSMTQLTAQIAAIQTALVDQQKNFQQQLKEQREQQQQLLQEVSRRQWEQPPPPPVHPGPAPQAPANANYQPLGQQRFQPRRQYNRPKCENCHKSNAFRCFHCLYCGDGSHKISECEKKKTEEAARNLNH